MRKTRSLLFFISLSFLFFHCQPDEKTTFCDVLVLGSGTGAVAAAIQSARTGAATILVNPQPWLGGMMTSAGVSAIDGNHRLPAGLWGEFRQHLRRHYGGADALATGWVSHTLFEPKTGALIWEKMTKAENKLSLRMNADWTAIEKNRRWIVTVQKEDGTTEKIKARILIDGTDLGDVAAAAGAGYDLGMDARNDTGESMASEQANDIVQDLTYVAILQDFGDSTDRTIPRPEGYDPSEFYCSCKVNCDDEKAHDCEKMLSYGRLPNNKYMINWPLEGNDYYANVAEMDRHERQEVYEKAKAHTLRFVYYIQHELGFSHLGLAAGEFPTYDKLALMPYHREGRRVHGLVQMNVNHILAPYETTLYRTGVAVGDYPIDHHHFKNTSAPKIEFPPVPSFNIPAGSLIPKGVDDLLIADKAISVTNIVNGSARLQPVVIQIGQAAGLMAAMSVVQNVSPSELDIRQVQDKLLDANGYLMPLIDVPPDHPHFTAIHRVAATGILRARGVPYKWANQTWFDVDTTLQTASLIKNLSNFDDRFSMSIKTAEEILTIGQTLEIIDRFSDQTGIHSPVFENRIELNDYLREHWSTDLKLDNYDTGRPVTKAELAVLIDHLIDPFHLKKINWTGGVSR